MYMEKTVQVSKFIVLNIKTICTNKIIFKDIKEYQ
jgi:hypothetical protein